MIMRVRVRIDYLKGDGQLNDMNQESLQHCKASKNVKVGTMLTEYRCKPLLDSNIVGIDNHSTL